MALPQKVPPVAALPFEPDFFVSPSGDDANPGSESRPWKSVAKAVAMSKAGVQICFEDGVYATSARPSLDANGTATAPIVWRARNIRKATFKGFQLRWSADYGRIDGINFDGGALEIESMYLTAARRAEVLNCSFVNSLGKAGIFASGTDQCTVAGTQFWKIGNHPSMDHGFYISGGVQWLYDCLAVGCAAWGYQFYPSDMDICAAHLTAYNNLNGSIILNNTGRGVLANCIFDRGPNGNDTVESAYTGTSADRWEIRNSIIFKHGGTGPRWSAGTPKLTANKDVDPQFVDPAANNFKVKSTSPAHGMADPAYLPPGAPNTVGWLGLVWGRSGATAPPPTPTPEPLPEPTPTPEPSDQCQAVKDELAAMTARARAAEAQVTTVKGAVC